MIIASSFYMALLLGKKVTTKTITLFLNLSHTLYEAGTIRGMYVFSEVIMGNVLLIVKQKN
jgi:hypothetical protein